jgi:hypothetical protein
MLEMKTDPSTVTSIITIFLNLVDEEGLDNGEPTTRGEKEALFNGPALAQLCPIRLGKKSLRLDTLTSRPEDPLALSEFEVTMYIDTCACAGMLRAEVNTRPESSSFHFAVGSNQARLRPRTVVSPLVTLSFSASK